MTNRRTIKHDALVLMMRDVGINVIDNTPPPPFNGAALHARVEAECRRRRISLTEAKEQAGMRSLSTFTRLKHDQAVDGNNIVLILKWLGTTDLAPFMR